MESRNPILRNSETFNGQAARTYGHPEYPASGAGYSGYAQTQGAPAGTDPSTWQVPARGDLQEPMTIDSVVSRTALTLFLVIATAGLTWVFLPDSLVPGEANYVTPAWIGGALIGAGVGMLLSIRPVVSPALVVVYAVAEGIFLGAMSEWFEQNVYQGIVIEAVVGTMAAFVATLAAYKFFNIKVDVGLPQVAEHRRYGLLRRRARRLPDQPVRHGARLQRVRTARSAHELHRARPRRCVYLIADFDMIERGVAAGAPEQESWRAAFALTAALVLIYVELLRILAIFNR